MDVVVIDCGIKNSLIKSLTNRGSNVILTPPQIKVEIIRDMKPAGVVISNGPGDPKMCKNIIENVKELTETNTPIFGVCLGMQILTLALHGDTYKLRFGHRGQNHPCLDLKTKRCYITSQNHGYAVNGESLDGTPLHATFINANDETIEGVAHERKSIFGTQFHPEASPGPNDSAYIFDLLLERLRKNRE